MKYLFTSPRAVALAALAGAAWLGSCGGKSDSRKLAEADAQPDAIFDRFKSQFVDSLWYYNPDMASDAGYHRYDSLLVVPNDASRLRLAKAQARMQKRLQTVQPGELSTNNQTDFRLIENYLNRSRWYADTLQQWQWNPSYYNLAAPVSEILNGRYWPLDRRLRAISSKLALASDYYEAAKSSLREPTREHTDLALLQTKGGLSVFGKGLEDSVARSGLSEAEKLLLRNRIENARQVMQGYSDFLRTEILAAGKFRSFRIGPALFARKFAYDIQSSYSADETYQKALAHKQALLHDMGRRAARLWPRYFAGQPVPADSLTLIRQVIGKLSEKHVAPANFVAAVQAQIPTLTRFVDEHQLLTQDPTKPLVVRETPAYMRGGGAGASVSAPGPYDKSADTYYNVEPLDGQTAAQAESYLREYNDYTLQILNIHEAIPGHYTQLVYANRSPSIIKAIFGNGAMIEGWAVYAERMMLESGYGDNTDEIWLMWDKWNMRVTLNAILDHEVHVNNISEQDAVAMLRRDGFQEEAEARNKWRRATLSQVQLSSYFSGYTAIYDLREEVKKRDGKNFDLKSFNEQFLSYGSAPVKYIREMMLKGK